MNIITGIILAVPMFVLNVWAEANWCETHRAKEIYPLRKAFLPQDGIRLVDFAFDDFGNWFVAGEERKTGIYRVWRINYSDKKTTRIFRGRAEAIDVFSAMPNETHIFAIIRNEIRIYTTSDGLLGLHRIIEQGGKNHRFTDLVYDRSTQNLFVSDAKTNQVYSYDIAHGYAKRPAAGNPDGRAIDDDTHLYRPRGVKIAAGDLYILQGPCDGRRLVRWTAFMSKRTYKYDFQVEGRSGFEISDTMPGYIYYRSHGDSVHKRCANMYDPNGPLLIAGGCGRCRMANQLQNRGTGALKMDQSGRLMIWDFNGNRFVSWDDRKLDCPNSVRSYVKWEDQVSYDAKDGSCKLTTTDNVELNMFYGLGAWANCDPCKDPQEVTHLSSSLPLPGTHDKQWCIEYFKIMGFTPGESVDYARRAICSPDTFSELPRPTRSTTTTALPTMAEERSWEDSVMFDAGKCEVFVGTVELRIYGEGAWAKCDPLEDFKDVSYVMGGQPMPSVEDKQGCIEFFKKLGFIPGHSLDYVREAVCGPNTFSHTT